jgi:hypothetical protein
MKNKEFPWLVIGHNDEVLVGAFTREVAQNLADYMGMSVRENNLLEITGDLSFDATSIWFDPGGNDTAVELFADTLHREFGVRQPSARGQRQTFDLGYVNITIKPAERPKKTLKVEE